MCSQNRPVIADLKQLGEARYDTSDLSIEFVSAINEMKGESNFSRGEK